MVKNGITFASTECFVQFAKLYAGMEAENAALKERISEISELEDTVAHNSKQINRLELEVETLERENSRLKCEIHTLESTNNLLRGDKDNMRRRIDDLIREASELRQAERPVSQQTEDFLTSVFKSMVKDSPKQALAFLNDFLPGQKISQIKLVREVTRWGLKESKEFVEGVYLPAECG